MITGRVYVELIEGQWQTMPAALISLDEENDGRVIVMVFPTPPTEPLTPVNVQVVSVETQAAPPIGGAWIYVAN